MRYNELKKGDILYRYAVNMQEKGVITYRFDAFNFEHWVNYEKNQACVSGDGKTKTRTLKNLDCGVAQVVNKVAFIWLTKCDIAMVKDILKKHYLDKICGYYKEAANVADILDLIEEGA